MNVFVLAFLLVCGDGDIVANYVIRSEVACNNVLSTFTSTHPAEAGHCVCAPIVTMAGTPMP